MPFQDGWVADSTGVLSQGLITLQGVAKTRFKMLRVFSYISIMARLLQIIERLKSVDIDEAAPKILLETQDVAIDLMQQRIRQGLNAEGDIIGLLKSVSYSLNKENKGGKAQFGVSDQYNTGDQFNAMSILIKDKDTFTVQSSVSYFKKNEERYGNQVFKLSKEEKASYANGAFRKAFRAYISDKTKLL